MRQLLTESLLISLLAGLCGWAMAAVAAPALVTMISSDTNPVRFDLALSTHVLLFCAGTCAVSVLFFRSFTRLADDCFAPDGRIA